MQSVINYLASNQTRFVGELCEYLRFPSVSAQPQYRQNIHTCAEWLVRHCEGIGLKAELHPTKGHPIVVAKTQHAKNAHRPHFIVYGHYDVMPPEPLDLWKSPPFEPRIEGNLLYARGSADNKGQHFAHLKAVESYFKSGTPLPCDLTFIIEGEEEVGSQNVTTFLEQHQSELKCNAIVISDTEMPSPECPALTYALRGIIEFAITLYGPTSDLHSGIFGGMVENPAMALSRLLAELCDETGRVTIPGFYDNVVQLSEFERKQFARLPTKESEFVKMLGVPKLFGELGYTSEERRSARPTFEINGLTSGYQGEGSKTIVPAWAKAKISCRLVSNQRPQQMLQLVCDYIAKICPPTVRLEIKRGDGAEPYLVSPESAPTQAALRALESAFGHKPVLLREGGSIPIVTEMKRILGVESLLLGLALPDANTHSPNEKFNLDCFAKGQLMSAYLWRELSTIYSQ